MATGLLTLAPGVAWAAAGTAVPAKAIRKAVTDAPATLPPGVDRAAAMKQMETVIALCKQEQENSRKNLLEKLRFEEQGIAFEDLLKIDSKNSNDKVRMAIYNRCSRARQDELDQQLGRIKSQNSEEQLSACTDTYKAGIKLAVKSDARITAACSDIARDSADISLCQQGEAACMMKHAETLAALERQASEARKVGEKIRTMLNHFAQNNFQVSKADVALMHRRLDILRNLKATGEDLSITNPKLPSMLELKNDTLRQYMRSLKISPTPDGKIDVDGYATRVAEFDASLTDKSRRSSILRESVVAQSLDSSQTSEDLSAYLKGQDDRLAQRQAYFADLSARYASSSRLLSSIDPNAPGPNPVPAGKAPQPTVPEATSTSPAGSPTVAIADATGALKAREGAPENLFGGSSASRPLDGLIAASRTLANSAGGTGSANTMVPYRAGGQPAIPTSRGLATTQNSENHFRESTGPAAPPQKEKSAIHEVSIQKNYEPNFTDHDEEPYKPAATVRVHVTQVNSDSGSRPSARPSSPNMAFATTDPISLSGATHSHEASTIYPSRREAARTADGIAAAYAASSELAVHSSRIKDASAKELRERLRKKMERHADEEDITTSPGDSMARTTASLFHSLQENEKTIADEAKRSPDFRLGAETDAEVRRLLGHGDINATNREDLSSITLSLFERIHSAHERSYRERLSSKEIH